MEPPLGDDEKSPSPPSSSTPRVPRPPPSSSLEIRLFYVRIAPCAPDAVPPHLTLSHLSKSPSSILEINGARNPISDPPFFSLRRDRVDRDLAEVTYVSTDSVFLSGAVDIEISDDRGNLILCGSLDRTDALSSVQHHAPSSSDKDPRTGWTMDCCTAASITSSAFVQPKLGISSPSFEVYVAGRFPAGTPVILTQTVHLAPRRKVARLGDVYSLLEDDETPVRVPRGEEGSQRRKGSPPLSIFWRPFTLSRIMLPFTDSDSMKRSVNFGGFGTMTEALLRRLAVALADVERSEVPVVLQRIRQQVSFTVQWATTEGFLMREETLSVLDFNARDPDVEWRRGEQGQWCRRVSPEEEVLLATIAACTKDLDSNRGDWEGAGDGGAGDGGDEDGVSTIRDSSPS